MQYLAPMSVLDAAIYRSTSLTPFNLNPCWHVASGVVDARAAGKSPELIRNAANRFSVCAFHFAAAAQALPVEQVAFAFLRGKFVECLKFGCCCCCKIW